MILEWKEEAALKGRCSLSHIMAANSLVHMGTRCPDCKDYEFWRLFHRNQDLGNKGVWKSEKPARDWQTSLYSLAFPTIPITPASSGIVQVELTIG
jgi:hypothetical protein